MNTLDMDNDALIEHTRRIMLSVYNWMAMGLFLTAGVAVAFASDSERVIELVQNKILFYGLLIGELLLVGFFSSVVNTMGSAAAFCVFLIYAGLNGVTISVIFYIYTAESIASTFVICGGTFAATSLIGYFTRHDLSSWGHYLFMALIGLIIASIANIFMNSEALYWITTYVGVIIFVGLTAYDTQKLKDSTYIQLDEEDRRRVGIQFALSLYLDFINLFLMLLRLFGRRR